MLSKWDDYPIHQAPLPATTTIGADAGRYNRHWMAMHDKDLTTQVGFGLSVHPNRGIVDASFSVSRDGRQRSVFGSAALTVDFDMEAAPLHLEVVEPGRVLRIVVDEYDGVAADLRFTAVTKHVEDSRMRRDSGHTLISERLRTVQFGEWSGWFEVDGVRTECSRDQWWGFRDRSWGSRTTGTTSEGQDSKSKSAIYFAWTLLRFDDECLLVAVNENAQGVSEARTGVVLPFLAEGEKAYGDDENLLRSDVFHFDIDYVPGTRRAREVDLTVGPRGAISRQIKIEPKVEFLMQGLGYYHPKWKHGTDHGGAVAGSDTWNVAEADPARIENVHAQQICRAVRSDGAVGLGLFEHVAIGPHLPTGFGEGTTS